MATSTATSVICDEGFVFTLLRSGRAKTIMNCFAGHWLIPVDVRNGIHDNALQSLISEGNIYSTDLDTDAECKLFVSLAYQGLHNGESACIAIALTRQWAIATDEKYCHRILQRNQTPVEIITTPDIVKHWSEVASPAVTEIRSTVLAIQEDGGYHPPLTHPLCNWWKSHGSLSKADLAI